MTKRQNPTMFSPMLLLDSVSNVMFAANLDLEYVCMFMCMCASGGACGDKASDEAGVEGQGAAEGPHAAGEALDMNMNPFKRGRGVEVTFHGMNGLHRSQLPWLPASWQLTVLLRYPACRLYLSTVAQAWRI